MADIFTKKKRREVMAKIHSKNTKLETRMKGILRKNAISFKFQPKLFGKPDFSVGTRTVIFCDSSFWHGRDWKKLKKKLAESKNSHYWLTHIKRNIERDKRVSKRLKEEGYLVVRVWDCEINRNDCRLASRLLKSCQ